MDIAIMIISIIILGIFIIFLISQFFNIIFRGFAPFISTRKKVITKIFNEFKLEKDFSGIVYELGSGKAGFLKAFARNYPKARLFGFEYSFLPYLISKIQQSFLKIILKSIRRIFFKFDMHGADIIYCYLNTKMMEKLEKKFKEECKTGTQIISYAFSLPNIKQEKVIELENKLKVYFYRV